MPMKQFPYTLGSLPPVVLAHEFAQLLRETIGCASLCQVINRNRELADSHPGACASHDYCDTNMVMDEAFYNLTGAHASETAGTGSQAGCMSDECLRLWNSAWDLAKANDFFPSPQHA